MGKVNDVVAKLRDAIRKEEAAKMVTRLSPTPKKKAVAAISKTVETNGKAKKKAVV
jgi:hypothetical protein